MTIGDKIRTYRTMKGLSQENVAKLLGISLNSFSKIERGETDITVTRLQQIADVLQIRITDIVGLGENGLYYVSGNQNSTNNPFINSHSKDSMEFIVELEKLRTENQGLKNEITHLKEIINLLKATA